MTARANDLLCKMATAIDEGHENSFDMDFYLTYPDAVLSELASKNLIVRCNDIVGTIKLTQIGYDAVKK